MDELTQWGLSQRAAGRAVGMHRATYRDPGQGVERSGELKRRISDLANRHTCYGSRRVTAVLRRDGERVNHQRVGRIGREEGRSLPRRRPRKRRAAAQRGLPTRAEYRGQVWTYDVVSDRTERGRALTMLVVLDAYTRECHQIRVGYTLGSEAVIAILSGRFEQHGTPGHIRSDNGGECIAARLTGWLSAQGAETVDLEPGHPWENGYAERFIGKFRDEGLNEEVVANARDAQAVVATWRRQENEERPHRWRGDRTPADGAQAGAVVAGPSSGAGAGLTS